MLLLPLTNIKMTKLNEKLSKTWTAQIYIAGQKETIEARLRFLVMAGACVTVEPARYIFTGGSEDGVRIGLIQYPRFEKPESDLAAFAVSIAKDLIETCNQLSASVVMPGETVWLYRAEKEGSKLP